MKPSEVVGSGEILHPQRPDFINNYRSDKPSSPWFGWQISR